MMQVHRWIFLCAVCLAVLGCASVTTRSLERESGSTLRYKQSGARSPVVVFEAGLGDMLQTWSKVLPLVGKFASTFAYNRAGYIGSQPGAQPRDAAHVVAELRELLKSRNLSPPYVLVGHSLGGLYMQYYARNFPEEVIGLVLVDATHWDHWERMRSNTPTLAALLQGMANFMPGAGRQEFEAMPLAQRQVKESPPLEAMPLVVLSAGQRIPALQPLRAALEAPFAKFLDQMQNELAAQLPTARHVIAERSDHYIQRSQPELIATAVRDVIDEWRARPSTLSLVPESSDSALARGQRP
jgi:pimeloyl-ACP methyl ester carboxylesterase